MKRKMMILFVFKTILGTMMAILSKHWFLMWMGLETNTMSILPLILSLQNRRKMESSIKYFIMQALSAATMLKAALIKIWSEGSWLINTPMKETSSKMMTVALFFKLSMAPFHLWFPEVMKGTSLIKGLMMTTWQKMAPTIITMSIIHSLKSKMVLFCSMLSILMGAWKGLNQTQTRKIMAFSSISHMGWIILMTIYKTKMALMMLLMYMIMKSTMFISLMSKKTTKIAKMKKKALIKPWKASTTMMALLSLGGLPPLTGFINKLLSMNMLIEKKATMLTVPLIVGSLVSLFFYLRMAFKMKMVTLPQNSLFMFKLKNKESSMKSWLMIMSTLGIALMPLTLSLGLAQ